MKIQKATRQATPYRQLLDYQWFRWCDVERDDAISLKLNEDYYICFVEGSGHRAEVLTPDSNVLPIEINLTWQYLTHNR